jgi:hypothetical protein
VLRDLPIAAPDDVAVGIDDEAGRTGRSLIDGEDRSHGGTYAADTVVGDGVVLLAIRRRDSSRGTNPTGWMRRDGDGG